MKILILGSKGFIGSHLEDYLSRKGHDVWGADILVDYSGNTNYFLIDETSSNFNSVFAHTGYDICINSSGAASVLESIKNPLRDYYLNTVNVFRILEAIRKFQPGCRFLNLSSAAVYGNPQRLPIVEGAPPGPLSPYGVHKHQAEQICREFYNFYKLHTCSVRIFSAYGPGLKKQLFWDLYKKIRSGKPFALFGTGDESRDFIYISDLVMALEIVSEHSDFKGNIINVANGEEIKIREAVAIFSGCFDIETKYSFTGEVRKGDPVNWQADITKLKQLGYRPKIDIRTGLQNYLEWVSTSENN
ncbi:MAG: NAD-dependent epimerase/dehydratase family protein [Bacteroidales bacterium]|nr:NAD-dependent epimerase/dehydratase family protein [Bacteroidales bacterium]